MSGNNLQERIIYKVVNSFFAVPEKQLPAEFDPGNILIVRQHNQFGDMLAGVSLFRGIKEKYPGCKITLLAGPQNFYGVEKNKFIDRLFVFRKKMLWNPLYLKKLSNVLRDNYDLVIVPVTVSVSFTSNLISRFSDAEYRIGPSSLNGVKNKSAFLFNVRENIDWKLQPDSNVAERILDIVRRLGISPSTYKSEITFDAEDVRKAGDFIRSLDLPPGKLLIGLHVGAGKDQNRWSLKKYVELIDMLDSSYNATFYFTGSSTDKEEINFMKKNLLVNAGYFLNRKITEVAALVSFSDLFISNDTGIMHAAGTTDTPQLSIFGPTNPYNWAPIGGNKYFIRKSELIDDITTNDVFDMCKVIIGRTAARVKRESV